LLALLPLDDLVHLTAACLRLVIVVAQSALMCSPMGQSAEKIISSRVRGAGPHGRMLGGHALAACRARRLGREPVTPVPRKLASGIAARMLAMYARRLPLPDHSFFLFGPRGTGKTTWLRAQLPGARWFDLVRTEEFLRLLRNPSLFRQAVEALPGSWVVVDEVQKLPALLDEVHALIAEHGNRYRFALSGSSARKLRRMEANLLAGRVINRTFFPLTGAELDYRFDVDDLLAFGTLPKVRAEPVHAVDILEAYVTNYIQEEIQQEALVKNLQSFSRFLEVAALMNGQVVNVAGIARDAGVPRPTVQRYFETLVGTLIGVWLPAWRPRRKVKEVAHPKFFFFDTGVVRALLAKLRDPLESAERGQLLETLVLHELRAWASIGNTGGTLSYWRTPTGSEADFIWSRGLLSVGIEVKAAKEWRSGYGRVLIELLDEKVVHKAFGVYLGREVLKQGKLEILPLVEFMKRLSAGRILSGADGSGGLVADVRDRRRGRSTRGGTRRRRRR
jgi:predicted AAA+ superfamily ATPase